MDQSRRLAKDDEEKIVQVFGPADGRALVHTEGTWRGHLARMAGR